MRTAEQKEKRKEENKAYYLKNKDKIKDKVKAYNLENKEEKKVYRSTNKGRIADVLKKYRLIHKDKIKGENRKYCLENKDKIKGHQLKKFGLTLEVYNQMFTNQEGKCKICNNHQSELRSALAVDHCHTTGEIRGLLCGNCNRQ